MTGIPNTKFQKAFIWLVVFGLFFNLTFDYFSYRQSRASDIAGNALKQEYQNLIERQTLDSSESARLKQVIKDDQAQESLSDRSFILVVFTDSFLILMLLVFFLSDLRARKKVERNFATSLNILRETNLALQEEQLRRQIKMKVTVHDLKNPLGSIRGFAELIADQPQYTNSVQEFSEIIRKISENSLQLVDSLLSISDNLQVQMEERNLVEVLDEVCLQLSVQASLKGQEIVRDFRPNTATVLGNPLKLNELFSNLIGNALKYSPPSSTVWVRCRSDQSATHVEIEDQGPGFSAEDKSKAFLFGQKLTAQPTGNESSTGIGLFTAKQIVDLHKGKIQILDSSRQGAVICVELATVTDSAAELFKSPNL